MARLAKVVKERRRALGLSVAKLSTMIAEAVADAHDEEEAVMGFAGMIEENVSCPFVAWVVSEEVRITGFVEGEGSDLLAVCVRKGREHRVHVADIAWAGKPPKGSEWIEAYRFWRGRR